MTRVISILAFGIISGTLIVPAGAQLIGRLIELLGIALQRHGEALGAGCQEYWRKFNGRPKIPAEVTVWRCSNWNEGIGERERRAVELDPSHRPFYGCELRRGHDGQHQSGGYLWD